MVAVLVDEARGGEPQDRLQRPGQLSLSGKSSKSRPHREVAGTGIFNGAALLPASWRCQDGATEQCPPRPADDAGSFHQSSLSGFFYEAWLFILFSLNRVVDAVTAGRAGAGGKQRRRRRWAGAVSVPVGRYPTAAAPNMAS